MTAPRTEGALRWNVIALALAGPALLGTLLWIVHGLTPARWCGVLIGAAREAAVPAPECTSILLQLLKVHRDLIWLLGGTLALVVVAIGLAATGLTFRGSVGVAEASLGDEQPS